MKTLSRSFLAMTTALFLVFSAGPAFAAAPKTSSGVKCTIWGNSKANTLKGTSKRDVICGLGGNDRITGAGGNDLIDGGAGNDTIHGGSGNDTIHGGSGNDTLNGGKGNDHLRGSSGNDYLDGGSNPDSLDGGTGENTCVFMAEDTVEPNCDSTAPTFSAVTAPETIDTSLESKVVTVTLTVADNLAGVDFVFITLSGPTGQLIQNGSATRISGDATSGRYRMLLTLPRYSQTGTWTINAELGDLAENRRQVQLSSITQTGTGDTSAPTFSAVTAPETIDTSLESKVVTVTLTVADNLAGVDFVFITLSGPTGQLIQNGSATRISGDATSGRYRMLLTLPRYSQTGTWTINAELGDLAENRRQVQIGEFRVANR